MEEFPRPVILAHRIGLAGFLLFMSSTLWRVLSRPVTMLNDFPVAALAVLCAIAGFLFTWFEGRKANFFLLICDGFLFLLGVFYLGAGK